LGGKVNDKLRTYASQLQFDWDSEFKALVQPQEYAEAALKAIAEGYDAVKVDPIQYDKDGNTYYDRTNIISRPEMKLYRARMQAIREAVG
ncbi:mandelate racemase/muconate lactonizing enzyme family protein, partial [Cobetia sp. SIMBA_158]